MRSRKKYFKKYYEKHGASHYELFGRSWYQRNKQRNSKRSRKWQKNNRKRMVEIVQTYVKRNKKKVSEYNKKFNQSLEGKHRFAKYNAKRKKLEFSLSLKEFSDLITKVCTYCGENKKQIGIDRIDNLKGYTKENSTACCAMCNYMKRNWKKIEFLNQIKKIYNYQLT